MSQTYRQRRESGAIETKLWLDAELDAALTAVAKKYHRYKADVLKIALVRYLRDTKALDADLADRVLSRPLHVMTAETTKPRQPLAHQWKEHDVLAGVRVCARCDLVLTRRVTQRCDPSRESVFRDAG